MGRKNARKEALILVMEAASFAAAAHGAQKRRIGELPYITHPLRVAEQAARAGMPQEAVAAALLHDVAEDTSVGLEEISRRFPPRVAELVCLLTQWWPDDAPEERKRLEGPKYYAAIGKDPDAVDLKLLDRADNLLDMASHLPRVRRWAETYLARSEEEVAPLLLFSRRKACHERFLQASKILRKALERFPEDLWTILR